MIVYKIVIQINHPKQTLDISSEITPGGYSILDVGQTVELKAPNVPGYSYLQVKFYVEDADRAQPICAPDTTLRLAEILPGEVQANLELIDPFVWSTDIKLTRSGGSIPINIGTENSLQQKSCQVKISVLSATLHN